MKIWCFEDDHNWGLMLARVAQERGHEPHMFTDANRPDSGYVFFHMHHHPSVRLYHKRAMAIMALNPNLTLIPDYRGSDLYDDKLEQARQLSRWLPRTRVFYTPSPARKFLDTGPRFPFISKSSEGASSYNVRLVTSDEQAREEIRDAFSDRGILRAQEQTQNGYLLWQEFVEGATHDHRVLAIGSKRMIVRRDNREDRPMASGSGKITHYSINKLTPEATRALAFANDFFQTEKIRWAGIDVIQDQSGRCRLLETTVGWTMNAYYDCEIIGDRRRRNGDAVWDVIIDEIEAGVFDD